MVKDKKVAVLRLFNTHIYIFIVFLLLKYFQSLKINATATKTTKNIDMTTFIKVAIW